MDIKSIIIYGLLGERIGRKSKHGYYPEYDYYIIKDENFYGVSNGIEYKEELSFEDIIAEDWEIRK